MGRMYAVEMRRALFSWKFLLSAAAIFMIHRLGRIFEYAPDVVSLFQDQTNFVEIIPALAAFPYCASFAEDLNNGLIYPLCTRGSVRQYAMAKLLAALFCVAASYLLGTLAFLAYSLAKLPLALYEDAFNYSAFYTTFMGFLLADHHPMLYLLMQFYCAMMVNLFYGAMTAAVSTVIPNRMFLWACPIVIGYGIMFLFWFLGAPNYVNPVQIMTGWISGDVARDSFIVFGMMGLLTALGGWLFVRGLRRRVKIA